MIYVEILQIMTKGRESTHRSFHQTSSGVFSNRRTQSTSLIRSSPYSDFLWNVDTPLPI